MSLSGFTMVFPIIQIKDKSTGNIHIIGTDSHDTLHINKRTGGLDYLNLQCCSGTGEGGDYEFVSEEENEYSPFVEVRFVTFEELMKIYQEQVEFSTEENKYFREILIPSIQKHFDEIKKNNGVIHT